MLAKEETMAIHDRYLTASRNNALAVVLGLAALAYAAMALASSTLSDGVAFAGMVFIGAVY